MKTANIYVRIYGYLIQEINIRFIRINSKHFILAASVFHDITIDTYKQERFLTFMLADGVYITRPLN